jgi:hypothetical protein
MCTIVSPAATLIRATAAGLRPSRSGWLDHRIDPGPAQRGRLPAAGLLVVELVAGEQRRDLEQVLVVVASAQLGRRAVAEHRTRPWAWHDLTQ